MGLFELFKKKKDIQADVAEVADEVKVEETAVKGAQMSEAAVEAEEAVNIEETVQTEEKIVTEEASVMPEESKEEKKAEAVAGVANDGRRFTLLAEDAHEMENNQGIVIGGMLHGSIQKEDTVYVLLPNGMITLTKVDAIEVGPGQYAERAENQKAALHFHDIKELNKVPRFSVLTSIRPQTTVDVSTSIENPQLLGLSIDYPRLCKDQTYLNLLIYVVCHTNFIVPTSMDKEPQKNGDGTATFTQRTMVRFPSLTDPNDKSKTLFPVFTDWSALSNWKNIFDEKHPAKTMIIKFPDAVAISRGNGIVINPFGPTSILLSSETIAQIVNMEGYKKEFGKEAEQTSAVQKVETNKEAKFWIGIPRENNEVKLVKDGLIAFGKRTEEVKRIDLLLKMDEEKNKAYLCVVDCPEEDAAKYFEKIHKAVGPFLAEIRAMEFLVYGKTKMAQDVVSEQSCIYTATTLDSME